MTEPLPASPPVSSARRSPRRPRRTVRAGLGVVALLVALVAVAPGVDARPAQDPTDTTVGPGTETSTPTSSGLDPTTVPAATPTTAAPDTGPGSDSVDDENRKIWMVVAGLVAVAVAISLLTVRYWRQTRPTAEASAVSPLDGSDQDGAAPVAKGKRKERGRRSRRAVAGADHAAADREWEPRGTGQQERIVVPAGERHTRPTLEQRAAAFAAADDQR